MNDEQLFLLIQKAKDKDQKAQTKLINVFWVDVFSFVMKKVKDENDADEITVNVFSKVLSKLICSIRIFSLKPDSNHCSKYHY
jgi:RNA polymerase sigma-70 factor (ECF subfamily)